MKSGINLLVTIDKNKIIRTVARSRVPNNGLCWTSNLRAEKIGINNNFYLHHDFHTHIKDMCDKGAIDLVKIKQFRANDRKDTDGKTVAGIVDPYELYNIERKKAIFALFSRDKAGRRLLLTVGSKSLREFRAVGHDMYSHSELPLLVSVKDKKFEQINL